MKHHLLRKKLLKKGWHEKDISHALDTFLKAEFKKHPLLLKLDRALAWIALFFSVFINFIVSFALIPLYLTMPMYVVIVCIFFFGFCFGIMIDIFVREIDYFDKNHYIIAGIFIPSLSIITMYYTMKTANVFSIYLPTAKTQNPFLLAIAYLISFSMPHIIYKFTEIEEHNVIKSH
jgi:hypothetical protein